MTRMQFALVAFTTVFATLTGCGGGDLTTYPVRGVVRYTDGKVLRGGSIEFELTGVEKPVLARGAIGPDGTFVLGTREFDDGAIQGTYRVVVIADYSIGNGAERPGMIPESELHPKYRRFRTSGLTETVQPEENTFVIEVEYANADSDDTTSEPNDAAAAE